MVSPESKERVPALEDVPRDPALLYASGVAYLGAIGATIYGLLTNPVTWSAWWMRNASFLFDCRMGWSVGAKVLPLALVFIGFACVALEEGSAARRLRWAALPVFVAVAIVEAVTWPTPGCPPG
jgi:hypothetical protein